MRIAVASQNFRTITGHAGKTRRFLIYETRADGQVQETGRLDMPREMSLHEFHGQGAHPLDAVQVVITTSCGPGFARKLAARGIQVALAEQEDPRTAAEDFATGRLLPADPAQIPEHDPDHHHH